MILQATIQSLAHASPFNKISASPWDLSRTNISVTKVALGNGNATWKFSSCEQNEIHLHLKKRC